MTDPNHTYEPQPWHNFGLVEPAPNILKLDERRLMEVASGIAMQGITLDGIIEIGDDLLTKRNPLLSHFIRDTIEYVMKNGEVPRSFTRGAVLALHLIDEAAENGAPKMGMGSFESASERRNNSSGTLDQLSAEARGLLSSQESLSGAFNEAYTGMPRDTDRAGARFGAGITILGEIVAVQFGGTGVEMWTMD